MSRLIDEIVEIKLSELAASAASASVNTVAVLGLSDKSDAEVAVKFDLNSVSEAYDDGESMSNITHSARSFFTETMTPGKLVCIPVSDEPSVSTITDILDGALAKGTDSDGNEIDFFHIYYQVPAEATAEDIIALIIGDKDNVGIDDWCVLNDKIFHLEVSDKEVGYAVLDGIQKELKNTAIYFHSETTGISAAGAAIADRCGNDPARGTWALQTFTSLTPNILTKTELKKAMDKGLNVYTSIAKVGCLINGFCGSATNFIDSVVKKAWVKFRIQEAVFNTLRQSNSGYGVTYGDPGIIAIQAAIQDVFTLAADGEHQYVMPDSYEVIVPKFADIPDEDRKKRNLPFVKATFQIQDYIHTVKTIQIQVVR